MGVTLREDCSTRSCVNAFVGCTSTICDDVPVECPRETAYLWPELAETKIVLLGGDLVYLP